MTIKHLGDTWNQLGATNPMWAVLTSRADWDPEEFFETGRRDIAKVMAYIDQLGIPLAKRQALDFACGLGRLSQALADYFDEVHGVDIAASMVAAAETYNRHDDRCRYYVNTKDNLQLFSDGQFDFIYSVLVLQHMPTRFARKYLAEFLRVLAQGGLLIFQLPGLWIGRNPLERLLFWVLPEPAWDRYRSLRPALVSKLRRTPRMELHGIAPAKVTALLSTWGGRVLEVRPTIDMVGTPDWDDYIYTVTKG